MSDDDISRLYRAINDLANVVEHRMTAVETRQETAHELLMEVRRDVKLMAINGCARAAEHDEANERLKVLESKTNGGMAISGGAGSIVGAAVMGFLQWFKGGG